MVTLRSGSVRHMPTAAVNEIQVTYADSGGEKPTVVLSHGFLLDQSMFDAQVAALTPEYRVITWDQRGHGGSPAPGPFSYWDSARDVLALLGHLGIERAVLGGMSQGGFLSLRAAMLAPQRVRGLILIDSQAGTEAEASRPGYEQLHQTWLDQGPAQCRRSSPRSSWALASGTAGTPRGPSSTPSGPPVTSASSPGRSGA